MLLDSAELIFAWLGCNGANSPTPFQAHFTAEFRLLLNMALLSILLYQTISDCFLGVLNVSCSSTLGLVPEPRLRTRGSGATAFSGRSFLSVPTGFEALNDSGSVQELGYSKLDECLGDCLLQCGAAGWAAVFAKWWCWQFVYIWAIPSVRYGIQHLRFHLNTSSYLSESVLPASNLVYELAHYGTSWFSIWW